MKLKDKISKEDIIKYYRELYNKKEIKGELKEEEEEQLLQWILIENFNKEVNNIKPLVMGGFPKLMYDAITPYYQIIASIFFIIGILLSILSVVGLYITSNSSLIWYMFPGFISFLFGCILILFINKVKV